MSSLKEAVIKNIDFCEVGNYPTYVTPFSQEDAASVVESLVTRPDQEVVIYQRIGAGEQLSSSTYIPAKSLIQGRQNLVQYLSDPNTAQIDIRPKVKRFA